MARTAKPGLEYFPFDTDFFSDLKIRKLIKRQGGKAITVYAYLLCIIYKNGYYMQWDDELPFIISESTGFEEAYISEVINSCLSVGLLNQDLYKKHRVLTSKGIQERFCKIHSLKRRKPSMENYRLIEADEDEEADVKIEKIDKKNDGKKNNSPIPPNPPELPIPPKSPKPESKVKPPITPVYSATFAEEVALMKTESIWIEQGVCIKFSIDKSKVPKLLDQFLAHCISECSDKPHTSLADAKRHFLNWYRNGYPLTKTKKQTEPKPPTANDYKFNGGFGGKDV